MAHIQIIIQESDEEKRSLLIATLSEWDAEGFEESENELKAYFSEETFEEEKFKRFLQDWQVEAQVTKLEATNWNALWESNFQPVFVDNFLHIRAHFHEPAAGVEHELVITPKMSFGTGHHATTWLMAQAMRTIDFKNKSVFDFGTGTGILAILAEKLGADNVWAIDNDSWSIENSIENAANNGAARIKMELADTFSADGEQFDVILANINKNVILDHLPALGKRLKRNGILLLSGLLVTDEQDIKLAASIQGLTITKRTERDNWICLQAQF